MSLLQINNHWITPCEHQRSPHCDLRSDPSDISLVVIHGISLPAGRFGGGHITELFMGKLDAGDHPDFAPISQLKVSSHLLIKRDGGLIQYVPFDQRAWHAGVSSFRGREACNDFSIGIELEGTDEIPYESSQYAKLGDVLLALSQTYPSLKKPLITGHSDIAPGRKTDPGKAFKWHKLAVMGFEHALA